MHDHQLSIMQDLLSGVGGFLGFLTPLCTFVVRTAIQRAVEQRTQAMMVAAKSNVTWDRIRGLGGRHLAKFGKSGEGAFERATALIQLENSQHVEGKDPKMLEKELRQLAYLDTMNDWVEQDRSGTRVLQLQRAVRAITPPFAFAGLNNGCCRQMSNRTAKDKDKQERDLRGETQDLEGDGA